MLRSRWNHVGCERRVHVERLPSAAHHRAASLTLDARQHWLAPLRSFRDCTTPSCSEPRDPSQSTPGDMNAAARMVVASLSTSHHCSVMSCALAAGASANRVHDSRFVAYIPCLQLCPRHRFMQLYTFGHVCVPTATLSGRVDHSVSAVCAAWRPTQIFYVFEPDG